MRAFSLEATGECRAMSDRFAMNLNALRFESGETVIAETEGLIASVFRYASGVAALRIRNRIGEIVALPFQGQQIADANFHGRRLTMRSMFDQPVVASTAVASSSTAAPPPWATRRRKIRIRCTANWPICPMTPLR
jgi:hypothetical protein